MRRRAKGNSQDIEDREEMYKAMRHKERGGSWMSTPNLTEIRRKKTHDIFTAAKLPQVIDSNMADHVGFGGHRSVRWAEVSKLYPEKSYSKLEGETLKDNVCPSKFLHTFQRRWREETGSACNTNLTTERLFKLMVKKAPPPQVQKCLDEVVGLMTMQWSLFSEHVELYRKEQKEKEEQARQLSNKLTQLGELTKNKNTGSSGDIGSSATHKSE